jgi:HlyD family secretion protein
MHASLSSRRVTVTVVTLLSALALAACGSSSKKAAFDLAPIARHTIEQYVTASGTLSALVSVDVGSQVSGKIQALYVDFNSPVKKGQLIAEIDSSTYAASVQQAEGQLASAEAGVLLKQQNLERKRLLVPQHAASQQDLDQATADLAQARATAVINRAALQSARANLGYCKITSPIDGIIIARKVDAGQTLAAQMSTPVLFTIAQNITHMHISATVAEADIGQVRVGQKVDFGVDAFPDEVFHGEVVQVRKAPTTVSNVVTYETIIGVDNPEQKLFPGMTTNVSIQVARRENILAVPNAALRFTPAAGTQFEQAPPSKLGRGERLAYTPGSDGSKLKAVVLKTGITDSTMTEVLSGAPEGTKVVTASLADVASIRGFSMGAGSSTGQ